MGGSRGDRVGNRVNVIMGLGTVILTFPVDEKVQI